MALSLETSSAKPFATQLAFPPTESQRRECGRLTVQVNLYRIPRPQITAIASSRLATGCIHLESYISLSDGAVASGEDNDLA